jgi:nitrogen-specific signal transduction histidine kinase
LAINARDAMPNGGHLSIQTENIVLNEDFVREHEGSRPGHHVLLTVSDNGCGISADARSHLFEPFFTTKAPGGGTGLGLSVSYFIVTEDHGGTLSVESSPGSGATFIIVTNLLPHTEEMMKEVLYDYNSDKAIELFNDAKAEAKRRNLDLAFENLDVENYASALFGVLR